MMLVLMLIKHCCTGADASLETGRDGRECGGRVFRLLGLSPHTLTNQVRNFVFEEAY